MYEHVFVNDAESTPTTDQMSYALDGLFTLSNAMHARFLRHVASFDRAEAWCEDGMHSMADWLAFRYSVSTQTARQLVDVAAALEDRPTIADAFEDGRLSWDKVVASAAAVTARSATKGFVLCAINAAASAYCDLMDVQ